MLTEVTLLYKCSLTHPLVLFSRVAWRSDLMMPSTYCETTLKVNSLGISMPRWVEQWVYLDIQQGQYQARYLETPRHLWSPRYVATFGCDWCRCLIKFLIALPFVSLFVCAFCVLCLSLLLFVCVCISLSQRLSLFELHALEHGWRMQLAR